MEMRRQREVSNRIWDLLRQKKKEKKEKRLRLLLLLLLIIILSGSPSEHLLAPGAARSGSRSPGAAGIPHHALPGRSSSLLLLSSSPVRRQTPTEHTERNRKMC
ncbi:uncharacterized protein V6R79_004578 [Siganus canaliculatus]